MIIAIDGPAGSGKSTVAKLVAEQLGFKYVDTGAMYRAIAAYVLAHGLDLANEQAIIQAAQVVDLDNIDEAKIRTPEVSRAVSLVAKIAEVRALAVAKQRAIAQNHNIVMEGRDIGSVVFPNAELKVYLNASVAERARRRYTEMLARGEKISLQVIEEDISRRDAIDQQRANSPLVKLPDAVEIDTTGLSIAEVVEGICNHVFSLACQA